MTEDRHNERDSQLSAMFDGELPGGECELLARRLTRDDALRAQWSRYSMIGAALRAERGVALHDRVALRVQSAIARETTYGQGADDTSADTARTPIAVPAVAGASTRKSWSRFAYPVAGASIAAGVAAVSIFWLRDAQGPVEMNLEASTSAPTTIVLTPEPSGSTVAVDTAGPRGSSGEAGQYSTPAPSSVTSIAPPARLANYVVAHSEYSGPLSRRMALLGIVGTEAGEGGSAAPEADAASDANGPNADGQGDVGQ
jgi:sigma-E factor negative regulatory protein RseA